LFQGVITYIRDGKEMVAFFGGLKAEMAEGIGGSSIIRVFDSNTDAPEGVAFAVPDDTGDQCLGWEPSGGKDEGSQ